MQHYLHPISQELVSDIKEQVPRRFGFMDSHLELQRIQREKITAKNCDHKFRDFEREKLGC